MIRRAFTLIELLVVIAITAILLTIIVLPILDSFNLLRSGQGWSEAQERARLLLDKIATEISHSAGTRINDGVGGQMAVIVPSGPGSPDPTVTELLNYAKLDIIKPAEGEPQVDALGNPLLVDPVTGKVDPTLHAPKGQTLLPAAAGPTIVRYFIGLNRPFLTAGSPQPGSYNNPYDGLLMAQNGIRDNLFVLRRAEVQPYVYNGNTYVVNQNFFAVDAQGNPILDDPMFFVPDGTIAKQQIINNWINASTIQTEVSRYDMVLPVYNKNNHLVVYDKNQATGDFSPRLVPLLQFRPTHISNEPATQQRTIRLGEEADNSGASGADVIRTAKGEWSNMIARTYPYPINGIANPQGLPYLVGRNGTRSDGSVGISIYQFDPATGGDDTTTGVELFDFATFANDISLGLTPYPFSDAVHASNVRSNWLNNAAYRALFAPYQPDTANGQLLASFGIDEVGVNAINAALGPNLPEGKSGTVAGPLTSTGTGAVWAGPGYTINDAFNFAWNTYNGTAGHGNLQPNIQRYIDLRVTANIDGTYGPLFPDSNVNIGGVHVVIAGNAGSFDRATIVPGSDQVWGPDQNPGPNYGNEIRYTRTTQAPGPNQYRINYTHQPEPANYETLGLTASDLIGFNPGVYDPTNFVSAAIQARYMPGYIELNSDPNAPLDTTGLNTVAGLPVPFRVFYRFQFTGPLDSYAIDYDSRQVMSLLLTLHDYPQTSVPNPQIVTLKTTATVRNFLR